MLEVANVTVCTRMDLYSSIDEKWQSSLSWVDLETLTALLVRASMSGEAKANRNDFVLSSDTPFHGTTP